MNLVILHPHILYPGGASKYMLEVAQGLVKKGIRVLVILTKYDQDLVRRYQGIELTEIGGSSTGSLIYWVTLPLFIWKLKKVLDKIPNKIIFPQIFPPVWWAAIYKYFSPKTKIVWMCQEPSAFIHSSLVIRSLRQPGKTIVYLLNPVLRALDKFLIKRVDYIIANSQYGKGLINKIYGRDADIFAYPSVDPIRYKPVLRKENYLFTISRLDKQKNIDLLIRAFALLPSELLDDYQLLIGGEGAEEKNLKTLAVELGIKERVKFLGRVDENELPLLYAKARLTVFLGENEPFGIIPVEAMSCGTPVIAMKGGGVVESVIDGETGVLLNDKNDKRLAKVIMKLLEDRKGLALMSRQSRLNVMSNFSWEKTTDKIYSFLKTIPK